MAAAPSTKPNGDKVRKRSFTGGLPLLNRSGSMADKTLLGVLNILRMEEEASNTFLVRTILPDGNLRLVSADYNMTIRDLVAGIVQEFHLENYQVRELPSKTVADLGAKASSVENSEIAIEDVERRMSNFELDNIHAIKDPRLRCVKELLYEEEQFFNDLKCVFEVYADPLRKWGMTRADYKAIFEPLETICNLNVRLNTMLEEAVKSWDTSTTLIGGIFTELDILWSTYDDYFQFFRGTRLYLKQKREYEPEFQAFINLQRGARNTHLEMLLLRPIHHVIDYERILTSLLDKTPADHPDRQDLDHVATNFRRIVRERCEEIAALENEVKINQVQDKFPHDNLCLVEGDLVPRYRANASRRRSAPSAVLKAALVPRPHLGVRGGLHDGGSLKVKAFTDATSICPLPARHFVQEGCAQVTVGVSTQERHLFLFSDLLLVAKSKSAATYKLKHRIRVSELWLTSCTEDVCESTKSAEKSFVLGWPTTNSVFTFSTVEVRDSWFSALEKYIKTQKQLEEPKVVSLKVYNRDMESADSFGASKSFTVSNFDDTSAVVKMSLEQFEIQTDDASEYHLWVLSGKENCAYPLLGHEFPFAIKMNHMKEASTSEEDGGNIFDFDQQLPSMDPLSPSTQCQFILTKSRKASKVSSLEVQQSSRKWKNPIKKSPIINWAMHKKTTGSKNQNSDSQSPPAGKLFELPLEVLCTEEEPVPKPIQDILRHMFRYGPGVNGIFRKSASAKRAKEIKLDLDSGKEVLFEEVSVGITASILKEFFRRLPDSILDSDDYEEFIATNNIEDRDERIKQIKWLLQNLNVYNYEILKRFMCVLYHIADNSKVNNMNAYNLAVCVAPSMLWPPKGSNIAATEQSSAVPPFVQFLIENCVEIFGEDVVTVLGDRSEIVLNREQPEPENGIEIRTYNSQLSTDDGLESPEPISPRNERNSLHLSDLNLYNADGRSKNLLSAGMPERNSVSTPSSPCISPNSSPKLRRPDIEISNQLRDAFYEPNSHSSQDGRRSFEPSELGYESTKMRIKGYRKIPRSRRQLSSTTTSAELIEHKQAKTTASGKKLETAVLRRAHSPLTVQALPVNSNIAKPIPKFYPSSSIVATANRIPPVRYAVRTQASASNGNEDRGASPDTSGLRSPSPTLTPDQVFQAVDRRRQPAAPSYHQHMLRKIGSKPAFFRGKNESAETLPNTAKNSTTEANDKHDGESKNPKTFTRSSSIPNERKPRPEPLDISQSEPCTPNAPLSPTKKEDQAWPDHRDDTSTSSGGSSSRRLEHSPFGLNLHHKRSSSDNIKKLHKASTSTKPQIKTVNSRQLLLNGGNTHFPPSEFFPHEATQVKSQWGAENPLHGQVVVNPSEKPPVLSLLSPDFERNPSGMSGTSPSLSRRTNSHTSSSSSVSSSDDRSSVGTSEMAVSETKTNITQIRDLKELISAQAQTNGLKISQETAQEIAKVKEIRAPEGRLHPPGYTSPSHDDMEKMLFTEESYV